MLPSMFIEPKTPSGTSAFAQLPHELMAQVFMHVDPHTLYTSIRQLNKHWKVTVESHIIPMLFRTHQWRVALRVHRRLRRIHQNNAAALATTRSQTRSHLTATGETDEERNHRVLSSLGAWEDEMQPPDSDPMQPRTITDYIPLELKSVNSTRNQFDFTTGKQWYALYELDHRALAGDAGFRLDLDFGVAWRFDGDGKDGEEQRPGGWTSLDQENGWLSKFYCSTYDLNSVLSGRRNSISDCEKEQHDVEIVKLNHTNLVRRRRLPAPEAPRGGRTEARADPFAPLDLYWDDKHVEYMHLDLSLGTEFFVRRSARANLLMRALEAEAARREAQDEAARPDETSVAATSKARAPSPSPHVAPTKPFLYRPKASSPASQQAQIPGIATPPPSRSSPNNLRPDWSPAEQLQMMVKSKAAARAAGGGSRKAAKSSAGWPRSASQQSSRAASRVPSRAPSAVPSRAPSRPPSRPGTPNGANAASNNSAGGADTALKTAANSLLPTSQIPGTPIASPRDMPFFRAAALSFSTASQHTYTALSGYTTPTANVASSFAPNEGGGTQSGGTPFAHFKARLRRAQGFRSATDAMNQIHRATQKALEVGAEDDDGSMAYRMAETLLSSSSSYPENGLSQFNLSSKTGQMQTATSASRSNRTRSSTITSLTFSPSVPAYWIRTASSRLEGQGIEREWRLAQVYEPIGSVDPTVTTPIDEPDEEIIMRAAGAPLETEWVWER